MMFLRFNQDMYFPFHRVYLSNDGRLVAWILQRFDLKAELYVEIYDGVIARTAYVPLQYVDQLEYFSYNGSTFCSLGSHICCYDDISKLISCKR